MAAYVLAMFDIVDRDWVREYVKNVKHIVAEHGGNYVARSTDYEQREGSYAPEFVVMIRFPDLESARGFYDDPKYVPFRESRISGSVSNFYLVPGDDAT